METNESILGREVVSLDDHRKMGKVEGLTVDYDTGSIANFLLSSHATRDSLVLPFARTLSIGDTFIVVDKHDDVLPTNDASTKLAVVDGYNPIGADIFSRLGNQMGKVESFQFDVVYGNITSLFSGDGTEYPEESILFFSPDYIFIDDGKTLPKAMREEAAHNTSTSASAVNTQPILQEQQPTQRVAPPAYQPMRATSQKAYSTAQDASNTDKSSETNAEQAELRQALIGETLCEDVKSIDGKFNAKKGEKVDKAMLDQAEQHDAMIALTMAVEF